MNFGPPSHLRGIDSRYMDWMYELKGEPSPRRSKAKLKKIDTPLDSLTLVFE